MAKGRIFGPYIVARYIESFIIILHFGSRRPWPCGTGYRTIYSIPC